MSSKSETQNDRNTEQPLLLDAKGVFCIYEGLEKAANVVALKGLNLEIKPGEFVAVVGTSGAGKSTLLRILGGLQKPSAGEISYYGHNVSGLTEDQLVPIRRQMIGFIFQEGNLMPEMSAFNNVVQTLRYSGAGFTEARTRAREILIRLGLESRMHAIPDKLSGGERQRVAIARALANKPALILADEPTGNLDYMNTDQVMQIFKELHEEMDTAFLIVTHSQHVASYANRSVELTDGMIVGEHMAGSNLYDLDVSRSVIVSPNGNMTLPEEMQDIFTTYGYNWDFSFEMTPEGPKIIGTPSKFSNGMDNTSNNTSVPPIVKKDICPVCKVKLKENSSFFCHSCGAKLN